MEELTLLHRLLQPIDGTRPHEVGTLVAYHGRLMVLAWAVIVPLAIVTTRFFKILPWQNWPEELDNPTWWHIHWKGQSLAMLLTFLGVVLILFADHGTTFALHRMLGYGITAFGTMQLASGVFRGTKGGPSAPAPDGSWRGDHFCMTRWRLRFELLHKSLGFALLLGGLATVLSGLWAANGPLWLWIVITFWWLVLAVVAGFLEWRFGSYDTYQAIWGPAPDLPGNRMKHRSFGSVRPGDQALVWFNKPPQGGWTSSLDRVERAANRERSHE